MGKHLVFYDGECGLCDQIVQILLYLDKEKIFLFAPLQGVTAKEYISELPESVKQADSLILIEDFKTSERENFLFGKGVFRIMWLLGGGWKLLGWISLLPSFLYDWAYRFVARNRHRFFASKCVIPSPDQKERFLP